MSLGRAAIEQMKLSQGVLKVSQGVIDAVADPVRSRLFAIAAARKAKWIVAGIWLAVFLGSFALDLPGKFADAEQNENVDYLPASAESTKALGVAERLNDGDVAPAIVVYRRDGGLTPGDRAAIAAHVAELNRATRAFDNTTPFGAPVVSRDGTTALVQNQVKVTGEDDDILVPVEHDLRDANASDTRLLVPLTLLIVLAILVGLLRALVAPLVLVATVILSFLASLGVGAVVFDVVFGFPGAAPDIPLFAFIFLVALGVDYNIFLMARVREATLRHGAGQGMLRGLAVTGGVITSAGIVLAGTFAVLAVLPLVFLTELGFLIAFGVLLDTFVVRSVLVPAITFETGPRIWWPSSIDEERRRGRRARAASGR